MVIIVGAGPTGLATAYHLQQRSIPYLVLEQDEVGAVWQKHYEGLELHTLKQVSGLPGWPIPDHYPRFPSGKQVTQYLQEYAQHFDLNIQTGVTVHEARYETDGWHLDTDAGQFQAEILVAATGIWSNPRRPHFPGEENFKGRILHANDYQSPAPFEGQRVLVVGVGNTGTEIAVQLGRAGLETGIAARSGVDFVPYPTSALGMRVLAWFCRVAPDPLVEGVLKLVRKDFSHLGLDPSPGRRMDAYPVVGYELPEAVETGLVTVYPGVDHFLPHGVHFSDGREAAFDAVILATGYRPTLDFVRHELEFTPEGQPKLDNHRSTKNPQLYCVGFYYPATEGFLQSIGRVTGEAVESIAQQLEKVKA